MNAIRKLLKRTADEEGVSLVEVLVAMMVFSIIAVGVSASLITVLRMTEDTRSRLVASNLATSELDLARAMEDPFDVVNGARTVPVSGKNYVVTRTTSWVTTSGADVGCGSGGGLMQSKRVNVTVTWAGMLSTTQPVRSDTLISPDDRINDPSLGSIRVSVLNAAGTGSAGVGVTITPGSTGKPLTQQPEPTDTDGCSYALKVFPGTYTITISRAGSIDSAQNPAPTKTLEVKAGGSVAAQFQYDDAATFNILYAANYTGPAPKLPENLDITFVSTYGLYLQSGRPSQVKLHPFPSGYAGIAGKYAAPVVGVTGGCLSVDPGAWPEATVGGVMLASGQRTPNVAAAPKGAVNMSISMGVLNVKTTQDRYIFAVPATAPADANDPGCAVNTTYTFGKITAGTTALALPYGSWTLMQGTTANGSDKTAIPQSDISLLGSPLKLLAGSPVTTLDPRMPK